MPPAAALAIEGEMILTLSRVQVDGNAQTAAGATKRPPPGNAAAAERLAIRFVGYSIIR
jgi:hypothetical protein